MNRIICAARAVWYNYYEPRRLAKERTCAVAPPLDPLISIYIPTFNRRELLLSRAIPSVRKQSYPYWELIIAAHGCTDGTANAVLQIRDPRIKVLEVPRHRTYPPTAENHWLVGPVVPANAALSIVRGDWIARIDDDDIWTEDHLQKLLNYAVTGNHEFVSAAHTANGLFVTPYLLGSTKIGGTQTWLYRSYLKFFKYNIDCWRKTWNRVNDTDLQFRMWKAGVRMGYMPYVVAHIKPRPGETEIGSRAYLSDPEAKERQFAFTPQQQHKHRRP